jgi:uncharacterized repeat protein (TIGR03803 family)
VYVDFRTLHRFNGREDGSNPEAGLVNANGTLYGVTFSTIFRVDPATGHVDTKFELESAGAEGADATLRYVKGNLYGTTFLGGNSDDGTVFHVRPMGRGSVLYSFLKNDGDGEEPFGSLTCANGLLYGTTKLGGDGFGTIFSVDPTTGVETVLYRFAGGSDGAYPLGTLLDLNGTFYGTTCCGGTNGDGTLFSVGPDGSKSTIYNFGGGADGVGPNGGLTAIEGVIYGTTQFGGSHKVGTVFSATTSGAEKVLYSFKGGADGIEPLAGVIDLNGTLYGTTSSGGTGTCTYGSSGCGTIFSLNGAGRERVLYDFKSGSGGFYPKAELLAFGDTLYGTTELGGINCDGLNRGCGVVFSLRPPMPYESGPAPASSR